MTLANRYATKYKRECAIVFCMFALALPLGAQTSGWQNPFLDDKGFSVSLGIGHAQFRDRLINDLRYEGLTTTANIGYSFSGSLRHEVNLQLGTDFLHNRYAMNPWTAKYSIKYSIHDYFAKQDLLVGGFFNFSNFLYNNDYFDAQHNYWASHIDVGFSINKFYRVSDKVALSVPFYLPLVGFKSRPDADRNLILNEPDRKPSEVLSRINSHYKFGIVGDGFFYFGAGLEAIYRFCGTEHLTAGYHLFFEQDKLGARPQYQYISHSLSFKYAL